MNGIIKIAIVVALLVAVSLVFAIKQGQRADHGDVETATAGDGQGPAIAESAAVQVADRNLPRMIDLGAGKCIPCKAMKPILDDLRTNYADCFQTIFVDVWENTDKAKEYAIKTIPTQIFYNADGRELYRHEGFYSKEEILAKWKELGVKVEKGTR